MNVTDIERLASKVEGTRNVVVISKRGQFTAGIAWGRKSQRTNEEQTLPAFAARPPRKHEDGRAAWRVCTIRKMRRISPLPPSLPPSLPLSLSLSLFALHPTSHLLVSSSYFYAAAEAERTSGRRTKETRLLSLRRSPLALLCPVSEASTWPPQEEDPCARGRWAYGQTEDGRAGGAADRGEEGRRGGYWGR